MHISQTIALLMAIAVTPSLPVKSLKDLITLARNRPVRLNAGNRAGVQSVAQAPATRTEQAGRLRYRHFEMRSKSGRKKAAEPHGYWAARQSQAMRAMLSTPEEFATLLARADSPQLEPARIYTMTPRAPVRR